MATSLAKIGAVPSVLSEMRALEVGPDYLPPEISWWCQVNRRCYEGARYCVNTSYGNIDGDVGIIGRMSLPAPIPSETNGSEPPIDAVAVPSFSTPDGLTSGDVSDVPASRFYRIAWADETTAAVQAETGDTQFWIRDARSILQGAPLGTFGGLSEAVEVPIGGSDTAVAITDVNWLVPTDYRITHAYVFVSDTESESFYRWVGKMQYDPTTFEWTPLYDTLSFEVLSTRFVHNQQYLAMPTFEGACTWGFRFVGFTSSDVGLNTENNEVYFNLTQGSKKVILSDENGDPLTDKAWPRWVEQGGGFLQIDGLPEAYEFDAIDSDLTKRYIAYLATPYQGETDANAEGKISGTNQLYVGIANEQVQEQVQASFIINGYEAFGGKITAVRAEQRGDTLLIFTQTRTYSLRGLATNELAQSVPTFNGSFTVVSRTYGCIGPTAVCDGPDGVFALTASAVVFATSAQVQDMTSDAIREWLRTRQADDKRNAVMAFDPTRNLLYTIIGEDCLVFDTGLGAWTVWEGARWKYVCVVNGQAAGLTTQGAGSKVLVQDAVGDVNLVDENMLADKGRPGETHFATVVSYSPGTIVVSAVSNEDIRGVSVRILTGTNERSEALITSVEEGVVMGTWDVSVGSWTSGDPSAGNIVAFGPIRTRYQTGALPPIAAPSHRVVATRLVLNEEVNNNVAPSVRLGVSVFGGGESADVTGDSQPTSQRTMSLAQARTSKDVGVPLSAQTRRVVFGIDYIQPPSSRIRINAFDIITDEPDRTRTP